MSRQPAQYEIRQDKEFIESLFDEDFSESLDLGPIEIKPGQKRYEIAIPEFDI